MNTIILPRKLDQKAQICIEEVFGLSLGCGTYNPESSFNVFP
jgi:hypothetical protein